MNVFTSRAALLACALFASTSALACSSASSTTTATSSSSTGAGAGAPWTPPVVTSFARLGAHDEILGVGVVVPVKSFEDLPAFDPAFENELGLEMPASVRDKTFIQLLRINWFQSGHGPAPYDQPHFDLHFFRGAAHDIDKITCVDTAPFPPSILVPGYETPSTCVPKMGYHAWPTADVTSGEFTASIILGYADQKMVFVEPMVSRDVFLARKTFERAIPAPASTGGDPTLFPTRLTATYEPSDDTYSLEFGAFVDVP